MAEEQLIEIPAAPASAETKGHYFVYGEWTRVVEGTKVTTSLDLQAPPSQDRLVKMGMNEAIAMHPAIFTVLIQEARPGYTVKAWSGISEDLFKWYIDVQKRKQAAIQAAMSQNGAH